MFSGISDGVFAAQVNESSGLDGYGWQQVYDTTISPAVRLTGSADRQYYDWGYKNITITGRIENYWATDCGWWYVSGQPDIESFEIWDNKSGLVVDQGPLSTSKGLANYTYAWGSDDDPGRWTVRIKNGTVVTSFYIYVRGQLDVTSVITAQAGTTVTVNATVEDHAGNNVNGTDGLPNPTVTAYVSGPGYANSGELTWTSPYWTEDFTLTTPGDYYITVKASDNHQYWIDGRGSNKTAVTGTFPSTFGGFGSSGSLIKAVIMILLALLLLRSGRKAAMAAVLIFMGGIK